MKIHGTAKGGAISKKDFGVAFSSNGGGGVPMDTDLTNTSDFTISTTTATNDTATRDATGEYNSSWAYQSEPITASKYLEYYINGNLVYTSERFNSGTYYPAIQTDRNSDGVSWQLVSYASDHAEWKLIAAPGNIWSSVIGLNSSTSMPGWLETKAAFFIGSGTPNTVYVVQYDGSTNYDWQRSPASTPNINDTFKIVIN